MASALLSLQVSGIASQSDDDAAATTGCRRPLLANSARVVHHRLSSWLIAAAGDIGHVCSLFCLISICGMRPGAGSEVVDD